MPLVIGYNLSHDSSVCLVDDGRIRAAAALERSCRIKRGVVAAHAYAAAMARLTREVLDGERLSTADIDHWIATSTESRDQQDEDQLADSLGLIVPEARRLAMPHPAHHLAHASAAFYTSGFEQASALVVDAYGSRYGAGRERETGFAFRPGEMPQVVLRNERDHHRIAGRMRQDGTIGLPEQLSGIGELYRVITLALGFFEAGTYDDAGKTMGLAPFGKRISRETLFIDVTPGGLRFDRAAASLVGLGFAVRDAAGLRLLPRPAGAPLQDKHRDLAAQIQIEFEEACLYLVRDLVSRTNLPSLVLSGGCFLNSVLNARLLRDAPIDRLSVFPAATDDGNAAGAALYAHHNLTAAAGRQLKAGPAPRLRHVYLGPPRLTGRDIPALARGWGLEPIEHCSMADAAAAAAKAIAEGQIIGWFDDRGELGPRALGARSILCHPGIPGMKDVLNHKVKFRETFRPFAGAVLAERADKWFEMATPDSPFMLQVWPVAQHARGQVTEIVHVDGTCRVQTVAADLPGSFRGLLEAFDRLTGLPVLLNTSFNLRGMPIVERPEEALDCLYGSRLDRVFLGPVEVSAPDFGALAPAATDILEAQTDGVAAAVLQLADGDRPLTAIAQVAGASVDDVIDTALDLRRRRLLRWNGLPALTPPSLPLPQYEAQPTGQ
ncbi:carbamoyltransferase C-terminal domain-containing protein [Asanoa siamensis]|uniref:Carbamoyltransferase n=1 Tax=Asanoa siamensis TaxID=926357 RepID=A0ABQ4CWG5_9ACTN|nr:carbamoyltransferase C-terminal domain-containing protein [Asanoa siamensis]GIF75632.1 carbamoyltransferase [Asanoa siamensis]